MSNLNAVKKLAFPIIKIAISVFILSWLFYQASNDNQFAEVAQRPKNWTWLIVAFQFVFLAHFVSFVRWRMLVRALDVSFSTLDAVRIGLIGVFFGLFAFGLIGGDSLRVYYAARDSKKKLPEIVCSVFLDRAIGMLTMFTFATIGFLFVDLSLDNAKNPEQMKIIRYACTMISVVTVTGWTCAVVFLLSPRILASKLISVLMRLPRVGSIFKQLIESVLLYRKRIDCLVAAFCWSAIVNVCFIGGVFLTAVGINVERPPFNQHFIIAPFSMTANAIPLPGGIGGMEFVLSYFYDAMSISTSETEFGIVVAFTFRIFLLLIAAFGAIAWFFSRKQIEEVLAHEVVPEHAHGETVG